MSVICHTACMIYSAIPMVTYHCILSLKNTYRSSERLPTIRLSEYRKSTPCKGIFRFSSLSFLCFRFLYSITKLASTAVSLDTMLNADSLVENKKEIFSWERNWMTSKWRFGMKAKRKENQLPLLKEYIHKAMTGSMISMCWPELCHVKLYQILSGPSLSQHWASILCAITSFIFPSAGN